MRRLALLLLLAVPLQARSAPDDPDLLAPLTPSSSSTKRHPLQKHPKRPARPPAAATVERTELLVTLRSPLEGARLFVDDHELGRLPLPAGEVTPGSHVVTVRRPGFLDFTQTYRCQKGQRTEVTVQLEAVAGVLHIQGGPSGALVTLDGRLVGALPLEALTVSPGTHELRVEAPGFVAGVRPLVAVAGREETLRVELAPEASGLPSAAIPRSPAAEPLAVSASEGQPGFFSHWYVWAGLAVVAGGLAAGSWAAATHVHPTPAPGQVCAGNCDAVLNPHTGP